jgi:hydrogenase maturation protease
MILACGNTLRSDDGVGLLLASWASTRFREDARITVVIRQQWTPDLAEEIAQCESVLFIDCSLDAAPGSVQVVEVHLLAPTVGLATHHTGAAELLCFCRDLYGTLPRNALLLTVGAGSIELGAELSEPVAASIPHARAMLEDIVAGFLIP